nr:MAG: putative capsid protein [Picobirnavirus sp.]
MPDKSKDKKQKYKKNWKDYKKGGNDRKSKPPMDDDQQLGRSENPASLYYTDNLIGQAYSSFPYNVMTGQNLNLVPHTDGFVGNDTIPGVFMVRYVPGYGSFSEKTDAINMAAKALFAFVRKYNAGGTNYESADLMTYYMAMDQAYTLMLHTNLWLSTAGMYALGNRTLPLDIFAALGIDYQDLESNYLNYVGRYNIMVDKINRQFAVPNTLKIFLRRDIIASKYYFDSTSIKGQLYFFAPLGIFKWNGVTAGGSALVYENTPLFQNPEITMGDWLDYVNGVIDDLVASQDLAIMSGDTAKAFGEQNTYSLKMHDPEVKATLTFDESVLNQIENIVFASQQTGATVNAPVITSITQSNNTLSAQVAINKTPNLYPSRVIVNSHKDAPTWEDNLENTRLSIVFKEIGNSWTVYYGTELPFDAHIIQRSFVGGGNATINRYVIRNINTTLADGGVTTVEQSVFKTQMMVQSFDWHPFMYNYVYDATANTVEAWLPAGDVKQVLSLSPEEIMGTHDCAKLALFDASFRAIGSNTNR